LILGDGQIELVVTAVRGKKVDCRVLTGGELTDHKGINRRGGGLSGSALTDKDREGRASRGRTRHRLPRGLVRAAGRGCRERRACCLRAAGNDAGSSRRSNAARAIPRLEEIVVASDAVMVARGDLGIEVGYAELTWPAKAHPAGRPQTRSRDDHGDADDGVDDP
jgi:pyruvate kinase